MKFWVCVNNDLAGPLSPAEAVKLKGFTLFAWVCRDTAKNGKAEEHRAWKRAISFPELAAHFFPNYPAPLADGEEFSAVDSNRLPPKALTGDSDLPPDPAPEVAAEIDHKLDALITRRTSRRVKVPANASAPEPSETPDRTPGVTDREVLRLELEPLTVRLAAVEKSLSGISGGMGREAIRLEIEPLRKSLLLTEKAVEELKRAQGNADLLREVSELNKKLELTNRAIEAENAVSALARGEDAKRLSSLEAELGAFRAELASSLPAGSGKAPVLPAGTGILFRAKTVVLTGFCAALLFGVFLVHPFYRRSAAAQGPAPAALPRVQAATAPAAAPALSPVLNKEEPPEVVFARSYSAGPDEPPLSGVIAKDAEARGGIPAMADWSSEKVSDLYFRLLVSVPKTGGGRVEYYYGVYPLKKYIKPLNRGAARTLITSPQK